GDADDPGLPGPEPRRLHVDDGPSGARLRSRAAPTLWRPTLWSPALWSPALPHTSSMTRGTDNPRIAAARVGFLTASNGDPAWTGDAGGRTRRPWGVAGGRLRCGRDDRRSDRHDA